MNVRQMMLSWHRCFFLLVFAFRLKARKQRVGLKRPNEMKSASLVSLQLKTLSRCRCCYCRNIIMCQSYEYSRSFIYLWQPDTNKSSPATLSLFFFLILLLPGTLPALPVLVYSFFVPFGFDMRNLSLLHVCVDIKYTRFEALIRHTVRALIYM